MQFNKNKLLNETLDKYSETWRHLLNTGEYIDEKFLTKIDKYIYKDLKKKFEEIEIYNLLYLQDKGISIGLFAKLKIFFSGLKPLYIAEKQDIELAEKQKEKLRKQKLAKKRKKQLVNNITKVDIIPPC